VPKKLLMELEGKSKIALGGHPSTRELSELLKDAVDGNEIYAWDIGEAGLRLFHMDDARSVCSRRALRSLGGETNP